MTGGRPRKGNVGRVADRIESYLEKHGGSAEQGHVRADLFDSVFDEQASVRTLNAYVRAAVKMRPERLRIRRRQKPGRGNVWVNVLELRE